MKLIYYYSLDQGAPAEVGRNVFKKLLDKADILPFSEIKLFCKEKDAPYVKKQFKNTDIITYKNLNKISKNDVVHIPVLPTILPNSKFILYFYSKVIKREKIILQYHGDVRTELKSSYKDIISLVHILTYIFVPNLLKSADRVITHSYYMDKIIKKYGVKKCVVIPNAIEECWFQPLNTKETHIKEMTDKNKFSIFYHGRLSWEKGVDLLIKAAEIHIKNEPNTIIYLAGEGPQKSYLMELCTRLGLAKNVRFLGNIKKEEIMFFLKNVDAAIYPSRFDNFPLAILEALACANCPVYFSKNIGIYDFVVQRRFQLNYFELNIENISKILNSVFKVENKNITCQQMEFAKEYLWDLVILEYIKLYEDVLKD
ncbi:MAG: glycosyltransferase family 4 protein [Euryarchaeota archaeon]|nr:glycosyltransferase family 4 protein [Euryarchaeota archaeon]